MFRVSALIKTLRLSFIYTQTNALLINRIAKQIDAVIISHCDLPHLGAYPYARSHLGMTCPVYSTIPVVNMGKMCLYDMYQSKTNEVEFKTFSLEDVDNAFDKITPLRYSQPFTLTGKF